MPPSYMVAFAPRSGALPPPVSVLPPLSAVKMTSVRSQMPAALYASMTVASPRSTEASCAQAMRRMGWSAGTAVEQWPSRSACSACCGEWMAWKAR